MPDKILILGGTAEAAALARELTAQGIAVVSSLAGRLSQIPPLAGEIRVGGFGGVSGLVAYLRAEGITRVIDATHPFAGAISAHAAEACRECGLPLQQSIRPVWRKHPGDRWHWADDLAMAARMTPSLGKIVFLTVGAGGLSAFAARGGPRYVVRLIELPSGRLPLRDYRIVLGKGPFSVAEEMSVMRRFGVDLLVTKASGGASTEAKVTAARHLRLPVLLIRRP